MKILSVGIGGVLGALTRYFFSVQLNSRSLFPWGTLSVNLLGSFFLALFLTLALRHFYHRSLLILAVSTGFTGAFTTFSSLSVEAVDIYLKSPLLSLLYVFTSILAGLLLAYLGRYLGEIISGLFSEKTSENGVESIE